MKVIIFGASGSIGRNLVSQALDKLVANAVDFHATGSTINILYDSDPAQVRVQTQLLLLQAEELKSVQATVESIQSVADSSAS